MPSFRERLMTCKETIKEMSIQTPHKVWIGLASVLLSILLMTGPIVILANCFIFNDFMNLVLIGILVCVYCIILFSRIFYYKTITKKQVKDMHIFYLTDAGTCAIALCFGILIGIFI